MNFEIILRAIKTKPCKKCLPIDPTKLSADSDWENVMFTI